MTSYIKSAVKNALRAEFAKHALNTNIASQAAQAAISPASRSNSLAGLLRPLDSAKTQRQASLCARYPGTVLGRSIQGYNLLCDAHFVPLHRLSPRCYHRGSTFPHAINDYWKNGLCPATSVKRCEITREIAWAFHEKFCARPRITFIELRLGKFMPIVVLAEESKICRILRELVPLFGDGYMGYGAAIEYFRSAAVINCISLLDQREGQTTREYERIMEGVADSLGITYVGCKRLSAKCVQFKSNPYEAYNAVQQLRNKGCLAVKMEFNFKALETIHLADPYKIVYQRFLAHASAIDGVLKIYDHVERL